MDMQKSAEQDSGTYFDEANGHWIQSGRYRGRILCELPFQVEPGRGESPLDASFRYTPHIICNACKAILQVCNDKVASVSAEGGGLALKITVDYGLRQLQQSALLGCHLCSIFESSTLSTIRDGKPSPFHRAGEDNNSDYVFFGMSASDDEAALCNLSVEHGNNRLGVVCSTLRIYPLLSTDDSTQVAEEARLSPSLGRSTGDDVTFTLAKAWLHECNYRHQHSATARPHQTLAIIRLLYLHRSNTEVAARLVNYVEDKDYVALSHSWGDQRHVPRLLKATKSIMKEGINLSEYPRTFLDAIEVTLRLGYEYLWIDSLCIIQDSEDDWNIQSSVMSQIYQASALTIAALKSSDSRGGCFTSNRNPLALRSLSVKELGFRLEPLDKSQLGQLEVDASGPFASPLHTRAWVVQERLSAPRTLYYGSLGIYWECQKQIRSECHAEEYSTIRNRTKKHLREALIATAGEQRAPCKRSDAPGQRSFQDHWYEFLKLYTPCLLTYSKDKLMAIKSMIRDIERSGCGPNTKGLWKENLAGELLWHVAKIEGSAYGAYEPRGRLENGLPSWTWASVHGRIDYSFSAGAIDWKPYIDQSGGEEQVLNIETYRRSVEINENEEITLLRSDTSYAGWGGDFDEEYSWYYDVEPHPEGLLWIILIQRAVISEQPILRGARCLLVRRAHGDGYERVGFVQVRYGLESDNPFNTNGQAEMEVVRLV
jgi:hypothetical protein